MFSVTLSRIAQRTALVLCLLAFAHAYAQDGQIPANALASGPLEQNPAWQWNHDTHTGGDSRGTSRYPVYPDGPGSAAAREFVADYRDRAGQLWHLTFGRDTQPTHFVYDTYVALADPSQVKNVEMDMNQVMSDGRTVVLGVQCSGVSNSWEYTLIGTGDHWHRSNLHCNPASWGAHQWHHVQIASERDDDGNVTYDWVSFDGNLQRFRNAHGPSSQTLGWRPGILLVNFQLDGAQSRGTMDAFVHDLNIYRW